MFNKRYPKIRSLHFSIIRWYKPAIFDPGEIVKKHKLIEFNDHYLVYAN